MLKINSGECSVKRKKISLQEKLTELKHLEIPQNKVWELNETFSSTQLPQTPFGISFRHLKRH
ncbi:CLUMA_CG001757, isoform A [Clunio marinus]|uniref:CLUMA_CG001757, isoform A n=1 Tax=Clunio marinus TaxID=568069 RepID=A0A1J1HJ81_9DIPT|nr:CLUMA_CG001757, isoform A [Clunio marinus]